MNITKNKKIYFSIGAGLVVLSILALVIFGLKPSIEFAGGTIYEVKYNLAYPDIDTVRASVDTLGFGNVVVQPIGEDGYAIKTRFLTEEERLALKLSMTIDGTFVTEEVRYNSIGPSIGKELREKATTAFILVVIGIILFVAYAFRKLKRPISSYKYGITAVLCLVHDVVVTVGIYVLFGYVFGAELDSLFVVALLTVLGVSVNDTIVVFDRIRDNLLHNESINKKEAFAQTIDKSINETMARSINTSLTVVFVLLALYFVGPVSTKMFALTMTVGMVVGTFSSVFLAAPMLLLWKEEKEVKN